jgi:hypothetical protein
MRAGEILGIKRTFCAKRWRKTNPVDEHVAGRGVAESGEVKQGKEFY